MEKVYNAVIIDCKEVAEDAYEVGFELNCENFYFTPGQYVWVVLPELRYPDEHGNKRSFSIVSSFKSKNNQISCVFRKSDSGFKKTLISMPIGSTVRIDGPFGFCTLPQDEAVPVVFLVGGIGITSVFTMISHATVNKSPRRIILLYANKNLERTAYLSELKNLQQENKNITLVSHFGDLTSDLIVSNTRDVVNPTWYIFGPEVMVLGIGEILTKNNIQLDKIETEEFRLCTSKFYKENIEVIKTDDGFKMALDNAYNHIIVTDSDGKIVYANHGAEIITGYSIKEMLGNTPRLWGGLMAGDFYKSLWKTIKEDGKVFEGEFTNRKKSGDIYIARAKISPFFNPKNNNLIGFVGAEEEITKEKEIERKKTEFVSIASHQLRTPVSALNWLTEALQFNSQNLNPKQLVYVRDLSVQAKRLIELIEDLLDFSRIELKTALQEKHQIDISSFINKFVKEMEPYAASKKHTIILNVKITGPLTIEINEKSLYNMFQNLVSNAIDYSPDNTEVNINLEKVDGFIKASVSNKGPVIPDDEKPRIFERFYRGESVRKMKQEGTGLGLYVVKTVAEELGGKVGFESEEGKDTMFWFTIPLKLINKTK
ncbi:MAG TPA: ATP-binding protein [Candidatus Paceibacterota bacterium]